MKKGYKKVIKTRCPKCNDKVIYTYFEPIALEELTEKELTCSECQEKTC